MCKGEGTRTEPTGVGGGGYKTTASSYNESWCTSTQSSLFLAEAKMSSPVCRPPLHALILPGAFT